MYKKAPMAILAGAVLLTGVMIVWGMTSKRPVMVPVKPGERTLTPERMFVRAARIPVDAPPHHRKRPNSIVAQRPKSINKPTDYPMTHYLNPQVIAIQMIDAGVPVRSE